MFRPTHPGEDRSTGPRPPGQDRLFYEQECEMFPSSNALGRFSDKDTEEDNTMIFNVTPTLMRILTQPVDSPNLNPNEMAEWWMARRAEPTQAVDSANLAPNSLDVRAARPRWPRLRRTGKAKRAATAKGSTVAV
jgi:hypothetical protein